MTAIKQTIKRGFVFGSLFVAAALTISLSTCAPAQARNISQVNTCTERGCFNFANTPVAETRRRHRSGKPKVERRHTAPPTRAYDASGNIAQGVIGGRPAGCPWRFCGCEASLYKFGRIIPELNLAYNWIKKFPRTMPAPGMAAARPGHVMILLSHVEGRNWLVHDGNSGGGLTRRHVRSIAGYVIVNPDASRHAELYSAKKVSVP